MQRRAVLLALLMIVSGCGTGGSAAGPAVTAPKAPASTGSVLLAITIPQRPASASQRMPSYVSDGTMALAVYDGSTLLYAGNLFITTPAFSTLYARSGDTTVTPGDCTKGTLSATCTLSITAPAGEHTFGFTGYGELQGGVVAPENRYAQDRARHGDAADVHGPDRRGRPGRDDRRRGERTHRRR